MDNGRWRTLGNGCRVASPRKAPPGAMLEIQDEFDPPFEAVEPAECRGPVLFNSPHSGRIYPRAFLLTSRLDLATLRRSRSRWARGAREVRRGARWNATAPRRQHGPGGEPLRPVPCAARSGQNGAVHPNGRMRRPAARRIVVAAGGPPAPGLYPAPPRRGPGPRSRPA